MTEIIFRPIGTIHTPYHEGEETPIQSVLAGDSITGRAEVNPEFARGLKDLDGFSHCYLIYYFHKARIYTLHRAPFLDSESKGIFAIRHFERPNPIGFSIVKIISIEDNGIVFSGVDMLDGTPLLDIKPYVPDFDMRLDATKGWTAGKVK